MTATYDSRRARREAQRQRTLSGETLAEIFARNRADTTVCPVTGDLFATAGKLPSKAVKVLRRRCGVGT